VLLTSDIVAGYVQHCVCLCIGISAELYYVRNGIINDYALLFSLPVKPGVDTVFFDWQSLRRSPPDPQVALYCLSPEISHY